MFPVPGFWTTTMDSPDQGQRDSTGKAEYADGVLTITAPALGMKFSGNGRVRWDTRTFVQGGLTLPLELCRATRKTSRVHKVNTLSIPGKEVTFENTKAGVTLAGTLTLPEKGDYYPVVVLISGSGPQNRDEEVLGHKPFLVLADYLTRQGIGVLRFDDRGVGQSTGNFETATTLDFADDVEAAVNFLKNDRKIRNIGLVGHSEGGMIAPLVASRSGDVAFIVLLAGPGLRGDHILLEQQKEMGRVTGATRRERITRLP
ncbi:MAG: alpha/beta hydrolase family protein [Butyricimonas paravirosa]